MLHVKILLCNSGRVIGSIKEIMDSLAEIKEIFLCSDINHDFYHCVKNFKEED